MTNAAFIAGDWGTTSARFWLCDAQGGTLDAREGCGAATLRGSKPEFARHFAEMTAGWPETVPAVLCGTVGANIGWNEAGYATTPVSIDNPGNGAARWFEDGREVVILAGAKGINPIGEMDIMRGEETQIIGACVLESITDAIFALPGTHNKWVRVKDRQITSLMSSLSGELFAAISKHTVLVSKDIEPRTGAAYEDGVRASLSRGGADFLTLLFAARARNVTGQLADEDVTSFLSGLIIGADVAAASAAFGLEEDEPIRLICSKSLADSYSNALRLAGHHSVHISGEDCALAGLTEAWRRLFG